MEWSYDYAERRHAQLREHRNVVVLELLEKWLKAIVGPYLEGFKVMPICFTGTVEDDLATYDVPDIVEELLSMSFKLGWNLELSKNNRKLNLRFAEYPTAHIATISDWGFEQVYARKKLIDTEKIKTMIRTAVEHQLGRPGGMPAVFPIATGGNDEWILAHSNDFVALGWSLTRLGAALHIRKA